MKKNIRKAFLEDVEILHQLEVEIFEVPWSEQSIEEVIESSLGTFLVYLQEEEVVGYLGWLEIVDELHILNVGVRPDCRRRGIGKDLLTWVVDYADKHGYSLTLEVRETNEPAKLLYRTFGFQVEGRRKDYYGQGQDALLLWRR